MHVEGTSREKGADIQEGVAKSLLSSITLDPEVVTGDDPMAASAVGDGFLEMMAKYVKPFARTVN
jgi:hypothetical protein